MSRKRLYAGKKVDRKWSRAVIGSDDLKNALSEIGVVMQDADTQLFPARSLEAVKRHIYKIEYELTHAREYIPASEEKGQWVKTITFRELDRVGFAKVIANMADDLPIVNIRMREYTVKVKKIGAAYIYTVDDLAEAAHANISLSTEQAEGVVDVIERAVDKKAWLGDTKNGLPGLLTNPNIIAGPAANGASGFPQWSTKTNDEINSDLSAAINDPTDITNGVERGLNRILMPVKQINFLKNRRMASGTDTTLYKFFLENNPGVEIKELQYLKMKFQPSTGIVGAQVSMLAYKYDATKLTLEIPMDFTQYPPQERNFAFVVNCKLHYAGVIVYRPLSINLVEKIA